ncbi:MAG: hypothetical protein WC472_01085 [Candidatus Paceibacterota bacterium]
MSERKVAQFCGQCALSHYENVEYTKDKMNTWLLENPHIDKIISVNAYGYVYNQIHYSVVTVVYIER